MAADSSQFQSHSSFSDFASTHEGLMIGGGIILLVVLGGVMLRQKTTPTKPATASDTSGLENGNLVYKETGTTFSTTYNTLSNDPNLTTVTNSPTSIGNTTNSSSSTTTTTNPPPSTGGSGGGTPPPRKGLIWDKRYTVRGGETLSSIAVTVTRQCRQQGMPGSMSVTWHDLYAHNTTIVQKYAQQHGHNTNYWNWVFPGEILTIPHWG